MACLCLSNQIGQRQIGIRPGNKVAVMVIQQILLCTFSHTSQHTNDEMTFTALCIQSLKTMIDFLFGIVSDTACIEEDCVGLTKLFGSLVACHLHDGSYHFGICHIHLAAIRFNI